MDIQTFFAIIVGLATPVGTGIWAIWLVLKDPILKLLTSFNTLIESLKDQHIVCKSLVVSNEIKTEIIAAQQEVISKGRWLTIIADDDPVTRRMLLGICADISVETPLVVRSVATLQELFEHLAIANLIILDVFMRDCDPDKARYLIECAGSCPVVIFSATPFTKEEYTDAALVLHKPMGTRELEGYIREVMLKQFAPKDNNANA